MANSSGEDGVDNIALARRIFERGNDALRSNGDKESRALLLEGWRDFENEKGDEETRAKIIDKMPRRIKRRRRIIGEDGVNKSIIIIFSLLNSTFFMWIVSVFRATMDGKKYLTLYSQKTNPKDLILNFWRLPRLG